MKLLSYLAFLSCLEGLSFAVLVYWLDPRALLNRLGSVIGLLNAWWNVCLVVVYGSTDLGTALLFDHLSYVAVLGLTPLMGWFYLTFAGTSKRVIASILVPVAAVVVAVAGGYLTGGFPRAAFEPGPWGNVGIETPHLFWGTVSDVTAITLDFVYFVFLVRKRLTTPSWRLKRLISFILAGIIVVIPAYLVLSWISQTFTVPGLIFLPAALVMLLNLYLIAQYRFLQKETPRLDRSWAEIFPQPAFFFDKRARVLGTNHRARLLDGAPLLAAFPQTWVEPAQATPYETVTPLGRLHLSPHFDRFGDFAGAVGILQERAPEQGLSPRETEVLRLVAEGVRNQTIAERLFLSLGTVKRHVHSILTKTGARSREELILRFGKPPA